MRPRSSLPRLTRFVLAGVALELTTLALTQCAGAPLPDPPRPDRPLHARPVSAPPTASPSLALAPSPIPAPSPTLPQDAGLEPMPQPTSEAAPAPSPSPTTAVDTMPPVDADAGHCASAPQLLPNGAVPPAPPHAPLGQDLDVADDRPVYVLPGNSGDPRVIIYLHGMCGDVTAADYFREAVRAHGTLIALRGDTPCDNDRFKWRDDASKIQARIVAAFKRVNAERGGELKLGQALLFGYSQGADRAEKVAALFPQKYPRVVLGGAPMKASPQKLGHARRVAFLGGELETTENMRAGFDALQAAGIASRFFTLDCAYHGYFGSNAEAQLTDVLDWVMAP